MSLRSFTLQISAVAIGVILGASLAAKLPSAEAQSDKLSARQLEITDDNGKPVIRLASQNGRGEIIFLDQAGAPRITVRATEKGAHLVLGSENRPTLIGMRVEENGAYIDLLRDDKSRVVLHAEDSSAGWAAGTGERAQGSLSVDAEGASLTVVGPPDAGQAALFASMEQTGAILANDRGQTVVDLMNTKSGSGLVFRDQSLRPRLGIGLPKGEPGLAILDEDGETKWQMPK